ncbi:MAG: PD40 domain-containing protein [Anaerolineae bacterium]|nr:PD40 domain-containing protein [Anaerolineae bacterium]
MIHKNRHFKPLALTVAVTLCILLTTCTSKIPNANSHHILYLAGEESGNTQIWELDWETRNAQKLAQLPGDVLEYVISPDGQLILAPVLRTDGGQDLWMIETNNGHAKLWLDCTPDDCTAPSWSPDSQNIIYTRITDGTTTLWEATSDTGITHPFFPDSDIQAGYALWSPDGQQLAYVDPEGQVCIFTLSDADTQCIPAKMEARPTWSPDGNILLVTDMRLGTGFVSHILRVNLQSYMLLDLSRSFNVEDDAPAWSPNGQWIAFRSRAAGAAMGKQIWLMPANGVEAYALTAEPEFHYGPPVWAANSETLIVTQYSTEGNQTLWAISIATGSQEQLVTNGYRPQWATK